MALLFHVDGKLPNLALMRIAGACREMGERVELRKVTKEIDVERTLFDTDTEPVFASSIFDRSRPIVERILEVYPHARVGGTGWDLMTTLSDAGIPEDAPLDYSIYPDFSSSLGFTQRGCRLRCKFCVVPKKEGAVSEVATIGDIWRGDPWPRQILLLDNDFFGQERWRERIAEIKDGGFLVSFNQGINVRILDDEIAAAVASVSFTDNTFRFKRIYCAFDNPKDERTVMRGLERLARAGVKPYQIMVYMLIGYWPNETHEDRDARRKAIRSFGARPYPMPFVRDRELVGFQRWCIFGWDKTVPWEYFASMDYGKNHRPAGGEVDEDMQLSIPEWGG